eukprot:CAMPEP_0201518462 /NCGR_PEP_ID=MMETSP0161_2-20130828/9312_1 /ASSEMBLY_ACC=CAM_ASM_000251 /TAXON_ID=180227 /ORGANISM="Neoparamoeba aestuarina, Strain SoJaBio B1-5/56/2" /LENGTH=89 /DNA_ID=CAMNT_0047916249 /DNA_START=223 /DNA_END=487 /DNA_ORIENTATION=-
MTSMTLPLLPLPPLLSPLLSSLQYKTFISPTSPPLSSSSVEGEGEVRENKTGNDVATFIEIPEEKEKKKEENERKGNEGQQSEKGEEVG